MEWIFVVVCVCFAVVAVALVKHDQCLNAHADNLDDHDRRLSRLESLTRQENTTKEGTDAKHQTT